MTIDPKLQRRGEFPVDRPMDALRADHDLARQLFERYFQVQDANEKQETGHHLLALLEMHTALEENVFYRRVREVDPALVERCEQEHDQARQLIAYLKLMDENDPQAQQMFRQLADEILRHIDTEERQLFPEVEQAHLDMGAIGLEMQALETQMIADRYQRPVAPGMRL